MTRERMLDLQAALGHVGWHVTNEKELLTVEREQIHWKLEYRNSDCIIEMTFQLIADMGQATNDLRDISYGVTTDNRNRIWFSKRNSAEWRRNVKDFALALSRIPKSR